MNFIKLFSLFICLFLITMSCNNKHSKNNKNSPQITNNKTIVTDFVKSEFHIKGMTCEIGCARLIQSKLSKVDGIKFIKVSFKDSLGMVEYDTNKVDLKKINSIVNNIAGGDLYKITDTKVVGKFSKQ